jgi:membrane protease YdiL (CAAX protease family)
MKKVFWRIPIAFLMAVIVFLLSGTFAIELQNLTDLSEVIEEDYFHMFMLINSILVSLILTNGKLSRYGFNNSKNIPYLRIVSIIFAIEIVNFIILSFIPITGEVQDGVKYPILRLALSIWILASVSEEVFARGLFQGFLQPLSLTGLKVGTKFISLPVILSAVLFMLMHVFLIFEGLDVNLFYSILVSTFVLGIVAGYYREKTGSLIPAILAHMLANIFPTTFDYLQIYFM